jgi:AcrR family transcriptional regulator
MKEDLPHGSARHRQRRQQRREEVHALRVRRRERRHRETRDEILEAAREVLLERGAADLSLREIARRSGFTPGALYKYFASKDDVIRILADRAMEALLGEFAKIPPSLPPDQRAIEMGMAYLEFARRNPEDVAVITLHESTVHMMPMSDEHRQVEAAVTGVFKEGVASGIFAIADEQDADYIAYGAWALVQGLATFEQHQRPAVSERVRAKQRQLLTIFINGLRSDRPGPQA